PHVRRFASTQQWAQRSPQDTAQMKPCHWLPDEVAPPGSAALRAERACFLPATADCCERSVPAPVCNAWRTGKTTGHVRLAGAVPVPMVSVGDRAAFPSAVLPLCCGHRSGRRNRTVAPLAACCPDGPAPTGGTAACHVCSSVSAPDCGPG